MRRHAELAFRWGLLVPLVGSLFVVSFIESWAALKLAAIQAAIPHPGPWPWTVDGFILATALMVAAGAASHRGRSVWWPRAGLLASTGLSTVIQSIYAPNAAWYLHAWSPLAVLFSFECLVWLIFPKPAVAPAVARSAGERATAVHAESAVSLEPLPLPQTPGTVPRIPAPALERADEQALRRVRADRAAMQRIASKRGIDQATVDRLYARWNQPVTVGSSNGNGHRPMGESAA